MSMIKTSPPFDPGYMPQVQAVKVAHAGFRGHDLKTFIKRASHPLAEWVHRNPPKPGETLIHAIAMGSTESVGCNRNADGYPHAMLLRDTPTFEKYARFYMNHANKDPARSYGVIPKAYYDPEMQRVEIMVALNATKEAADRNGGLIADYTLNRLHHDLPIDVSQSCYITHDVCTGCGNKARTRAEYCGPEICRKYGGCRDNLGRTFDDGTTLFVENPDCKYYDLSDVSQTRGADRTAFVTGKVANTGYVLGGAAYAESLGLVVPEHILEPSVRGALRASRALMSATSKLASVLPVVTSFTSLLNARGQFPPPLPAKYATQDDRHRWVSDAGRAGLLLPPAWWMAACTGVTVEKCATFLGDTPISPTDDVDLLTKQALAAAHNPTQFADYAPTKRAFERLTWAESGVKTKRAASPVAPQQVKAVADRYAAYQANVLAAHENTKIFPLLLADAVVHNRDIDC